ncbi:MAG: amidohydrolase [Chloroflexi bacterium]|nr:amidohydrolase [Chloroflexota bacterium]
MTPPPTELLFRNGLVLTLDPERPEARAVAVHQGRIVAVGSEAEARHAVGRKARVVDLRGRALLPGFGDAHVHLALLGLRGRWLDLSGCAFAGDVLRLVKQRAMELPEGEWLYGWGWDPERLAEGRPSSRAEMDAAAPGRPVLLGRGDGHFGVANSLALAKAGITRTMPSPPGGEILRAPDGEPTGELSESAFHLAWNAMMAELASEDFVEPILKGAEIALRAGVTLAHCVLLENVAAEIEAFRELDEAGRLPLRCCLLVPVEALETLPTGLLHWRGTRAWVRAVKLFADGTLYARTAALRAPYADGEGGVGALNYDVGMLRSLIAKADGAGLQVAVHAVGDRAVEAVLDVYAAVVGREKRPRIEHATVLGPDLVERMARQGVVATLQPRRQAQLVARLGKERAGWANPWRALVDAGVHVAGSSDAPYLQPAPSPLAGLAEAVRKGLTVEEALRAFTYGPAYAAFLEDETGVLKPAMAADLVVLERDPRGLSPDEIERLAVEMTVVGGEVGSTRSP